MNLDIDLLFLALTMGSFCWPILAIPLLTLKQSESRLAFFLINIILAIGSVTIATIIWVPLNRFPVEFFLSVCNGNCDPILNFMTVNLEYIDAVWVVMVAGVGSILLYGGCYRYQQRRT
jgi:hypothetical protein